jgi:hypothetical protein
MIKTIIFLIFAILFSLLTLIYQLYLVQENLKQVLLQQEKQQLLLNKLSTLSGSNTSILKGNSTDLWSFNTITEPWVIITVTSVIIIGVVLIMIFFKPGGSDLGPGVPPVLSSPSSPSSSSNSISSSSSVEDFSDLISRSLNAETTTFLKKVDDTITDSAISISDNIEKYITHSTQKIFNKFDGSDEMVTFELQNILAQLLNNHHQNYLAVCESKLKTMAIITVKHLKDLNNTLLQNNLIMQDQVVMLNPDVAQAIVTASTSVT